MIAVVQADTGTTGLTLLEYVIVTGRLHLPSAATLTRKRRIQGIGGMMHDIARRKPTILQPLPNFSINERISQAKGLMRLFDLWNLTDQERTRLLGGQDGTEATLNHYRNGAPLDNAPDTLERAANLFAIHANLVRRYPENLQLAFSWVTTPNTAFEGRTPLDVMCNEGITGIKRVRYHLDDSLLG